MRYLAFANRCNTNSSTFQCQTKLKDDTYKILSFHCSKFLSEIILNRSTAFDSSYPVTGGLFVWFIFYIGIRLELDGIFITYQQYHILSDEYDFNISLPWNQ